MQLLFSFNGEINRSQWWLGEFASFVLLVLAFFTGLGPVSSGIIAPVLFIASFWIHFAVSAKRFRNHGFTPWLALLSLWPWIGWLVQVVMCGILPSERDRKLAALQRYSGLTQPVQFTTSAQSPIPSLPEITHRPQTAGDPNRPRLPGDRQGTRQTLF